ncbi:Uncharacterized protein TCM_040532 [Theobroma cacao]|uniref:Uncharacterized protein n=1 Tax=Theobroma cacao TaxID=3641 RepID=A0A061GSR1_THECC|nr:Uncharacterized protein TCM_040532 [Theobroma cacao]
MALREYKKSIDIESEAVNFSSASNLHACKISKSLPPSTEKWFAKDCTTNYHLTDSSAIYQPFDSFSCFGAEVASRYHFLELFSFDISNF